ncbi:MFS transporter [Thermogymnomonas acidicola]|uniref:MFS transporter n=1 Tax=Thermogymnomonas acidicola TaxID=399579 RepID=A0AA37BSC9_9ARCH|nr:MFS transporter [Thermogymnomonas acidicola]GGM77669.1 MFS transporter [Thermogymnomonas acidicola]
MEAARERRTNNRREILAASMVGTIIEWYGIFIFSSGAIYIASAFYPTVSRAESLLLTLLTFALGFVTRPVGAFVFGHFGDRMGRKNVLLITLLLSGISTGLTGVVPGYASIGIWAVVLLVILRLILGFGLGGEWGGAMLLTLENFRERRGFWSSFVQSTVGIGLIIGTAIFLLLEFVLPSKAMYAYGWRIPFLLAFAILAIGFLIRYRLAETPIFEAAKAEKKILGLPAGQLFRHHWHEVLAGTLLAGSSGNFFYFAISLLPAVFEVRGIISVTTGLIAVTVFAIMDIVFVFIGGILSDRHGRRILLFSANLIALVILYPSIYYYNPYAFTAFLAVFGIAHGLSYSPLGALISEVFPANVRYSGNSFSYQFGNSFIGGPAPYASDALGLISYPLYPVFTLVFILVAFVTIARIRESRGSDLGVLGEAGS